MLVVAGKQETGGRLGNVWPRDLDRTGDFRIVGFESDGREFSSSSQREELEVRRPGSCLKTEQT
jgi:hypothetical protein